MVPRRQFFLAQERLKASVSSSSYPTHWSCNYDKETIRVRLIYYVLKFNGGHTLSKTRILDIDFLSVIDFAPLVFMMSTISNQPSVPASIK